MMVPIQTLYAGTVRFNILLGATKPEAEVAQDELEQACKDANIHDFIMVRCRIEILYIPKILAETHHSVSAEPPGRV
jgi:hypothetical protein